MERVVYTEKLKITSRQKVGIVLWVILLLAFAIMGMAWYLLAAVALILAVEIWNLFNRIRTEYILTLEKLILKVGAKEVLAIPLTALQAVLRGTFRELLKTDAMKEIPYAEIQAVPKLGGVKEVAVLIYEDGSQRKAVFIQPSLALLLVLEDGFEA